MCKPNCPICNGMGWVRGDYPLGHPSFGKLIPCPDAPTPDPEGLIPDETALTWAGVARGNGAGAAVDAVQEIAQTGGWVYLWGRFGTGKTHILKTACAELARAGKASEYTNMAGILDYLRSAYDTERPSLESVDRINDLIHRPVLAIDEIDRFNPTGFAAEKRFVLFDARYVTGVRGQTITLMASNRPPSELDGYLSDRILDGRFKVIEIAGHTARPLIHRGIHRKIMPQASAVNG